MKHVKTCKKKFLSAVFFYQTLLVSQPLKKQTTCKCCNTPMVIQLTSGLHNSIRLAWQIVDIVLSMQHMEIWSGRTLVWRNISHNTSSLLYIWHCTSHSSKQNRTRFVKQDICTFSKNLAATFKFYMPEKQVPQFLLCGAFCSMWTDADFYMWGMGGELSTNYAENHCTKFIHLRFVDPCNMNLPISYSKRHGIQSAQG